MSDELPDDEAEAKETAVCAGCEGELDAAGDCTDGDCEFSPWYEEEAEETVEDEDLDLEADDEKESV